MRAVRQRAVALVAVSLATVVVACGGVPGGGTGGSGPGDITEATDVVELTTPSGVRLPKAVEINEQGQVMGTDTDVFSMPSQGLFWEQGETEGTVMTPPWWMGSNIRANDLNDEGLVVGSYRQEPLQSCQPGPTPRWDTAFTWHAGQWTNLDPGSDACNTTALYVNNQDQVVGTRATAGISLQQVVAWQGDEVAVAPVEALQPSSSVSVWGLNDQGQVLLTTRGTFGDAETALLWQIGSDEVTDLGDLGGGSARGLDINNRGQVVGYSHTAEGEFHAFLWEDGEMTDLGTVGGANSTAYGINEHGQVFGNGKAATGANHAFVWEDGEMTDLGTLGDNDYARANAINDQGQIVGTSANRAFLWEDGEMTDLGALIPDGSTGAVDINNQGQVVGTVSRSDGTANVVVWNTR